MIIKVRDYSVRLARNKEERRKVRMLRYDVFVEEEGASVSEEQKSLREEYDSFDKFADYMIVLHKDQIVGTYRIIDRDSAEKMGGFYTETEYNISKIKKMNGNIAEMSRACVSKEYRDNGLVMRMLWAGLGEYVAKRKIIALFGVASWAGKNPVDSAQAISYLYYNHLSPLKLRATVLSNKFVEGVNPKLSQMNILPEVFVDKDSAFKQMTPLIKGYVRLGASFGKGVFLDTAFNSYDVFVILQTKKIAANYQKHFTGNENTFSSFDEDSENVIKTIGKIMLFPVTGPFKMLIAFTRFLLRDYGDVEYIEDPKEEEQK